MGGSNRPFRCLEVITRGTKHWVLKLNRQYIWKQTPPNPSLLLWERRALLHLFSSIQIMTDPLISLSEFQKNNVVSICRRLLLLTWKSTCCFQTLFFPESYGNMLEKESSWEKLDYLDYLFIYRDYPRHFLPGELRKNIWEEIHLRKMVLFYSLWG